MCGKEIQYNDAFSMKWVEQLSPPEWRGKVEIGFTDVPLGRIEHAGCWTDAAVVSGWMRTLADGAPIPPPVAVLTERGTYYLHDGNHRFEAMSQFLGDDSESALVRVAVAVPLPGYEFVYRSCGEYGTYLLQGCPRRFAASASIIAAILASSTAIILSALLPGLDRTPIYALFVLSVMITAWAGSWKAGVLATSLNSIGAAYFLLPPNGSLMIEDPHHLVQFGATALVMMAAALFMQVVRRHPSIQLGLRTPTGAGSTRSLSRSARTGS